MEFRPTRVDAASLLHQSLVVAAVLDHSWFCDFLDGRFLDSWLGFNSTAMTKLYFFWSSTHMEGHWDKKWLRNGIW